MKLTGFTLFLLWLIAGAVMAQPSQQTWKECRYPVRGFGRQGTVNLTPLFQWWNHESAVETNQGAVIETNLVTGEARPLSAWYHVTGTKLGLTGGSWVLEAVVYTSPTVFTNTRVILNNPPDLEEQSYVACVTQLLEIKQEIASAQGVYSSETNAASLDQARAKVYEHSLSIPALGVARTYTAQAMQNLAQAQSAASELAQLETTQKQLEAQLKTIPHGNGSYLVDWFAMYIGNSKQGVPIYDLGMINPNQP